MLFSQLLSLSLLSSLAQAATPAQWRSKSVYQVLTDRFARTDGSTSASCITDNRTYCGGTYQGIINKLDYIQGMGFSAIWISPIVKQIEEKTGYGEAYHGYWAKDIYSLNTNFGSAADLLALSKALHNRGMYLMVDVAPNHFAHAGSHSGVDYGAFLPFNNADHFNDFCWITNYNNQRDVEDCWLGDDTVVLVDVKTEHEPVRSTYNSWVKKIVSTYGIDGLRVDTAKHVDKPFLRSFNDAAGVYSVGEVYSGNEAYTCGYQGTALDGVLNFPIYYPLLRAFQSTSGSMNDLASMISTVKGGCADTTLMGTFSENHDLPRFASYTGDLSLAKNILAFNILADGIPIIYAGQEQRYTGKNDPYNREATWLSGYPTTSALYTWIASLNKLRNRAINDSGNTYLTYKTWIIYSTSNALAMRKNQVITVLTNAGANGGSNTFTVGNTGYSGGTVVYDVLSCTSVTADGSGNISVTLNGGLPKAFYPRSLLSGSGICGL